MHASQKKVDVIWLLGSQRGRELAADEVRHGGWGEVGLVAHRVELGVGLDVVCELDCGLLELCLSQQRVWNTEVGKG